MSSRCWLSVAALSLLVSHYSQASDFATAVDAFKQYYQTQLGHPQRCMQQDFNTTRVCSLVLRNEGNAPYILHHQRTTDAVIVLFHGLSDSPFYFRSVAAALHQQGYNVVVALLPGHGLRDADADMQDPELETRWRDSVAEIVNLSRGLGRLHFVGGFSAGGALATEYVLNNPNTVTGLLLFSAALALSNNAEQMSRIVGMQTIAKWIDGDYVSHGMNPYKYPDVSLFAAFELMQVIRQIRSQLALANPSIPTFAAHSAADVTTPLHGVENFLAVNLAANTTFIVDERYELCHGDLLLDNAQVQAMAVTAPLDEVVDFCFVPEPNPLHKHMLAMLTHFIQQQIKLNPAE